MSKKITKKELSYLLYLLGFAFALIGILYGNNLGSKKETLEMENTKLEGEVAYLQDLMNHKQEYLDEMDVMNLEMEDIKAQFPTEIYPEDQIMYANGLESKFEVMLESIDMPGVEGVEVVTAAPQAAQQTTQAPAANANDVDALDETSAPAANANTTANNVAATTASSILLSKAGTTFSYQANYKGLKDIIRYINEDTDRKSIESLTVGYDATTGNLTGSLVTNMYALSGTGKEYTAPVVTGVTNGKPAIFSNVERLNRDVENRAGDAETADGKAVEDNAEDETAKEE